jgi:chromosome segregation ATPase
VLPAAPGFQPFEWAIICVLFVALVSMALFIRKESSARDASDRLANENKLKELADSVAEAIKSFSTRIDKTLEDIRQRAHDHAARIQTMGERLAVLESKRDDARDEQHQVRGELSKLNTEIGKLSMTVARIAGQMGITTSSSGSTGFVPPVPRVDRKER